MSRTWIGYDREKAIIVDVMEYEGDDFDRIQGATYVEIFPPLHVDAIKLEKDSDGNISIVRDDDKWAIIEPKLLRNFRQERDKRLADADWVTLRAYSSGTDVPEEWMTYMQALRDLPSTTKDPTNPVWPEPPNPSLVGEKMEKLAPRVSFLETSVASLISLDKQLNYKNAEMEILDIKVKNIESRLGMIEETLTSILSKLNI